MPPKKQRKNDKPILSSTQEEEMSSALIAKLLAQDAMQGGGSDYYAEYSNDSHQYERYRGGPEDHDDSYEDESDDYAPKRSKKPKKPKVKKADAQQQGRKRKNAPVENNTADSNATPDSTVDNAQSMPPDNSATKVKKVKKPLPPGFNTGVYTDDEEKLFLEGLDLHGRSWSDLSKHMGTRDPHSIRSHAQKHFIKLFRDNLPLPDKVKESGEGFTLSGKPLDPESAAAKSYLSRGATGLKIDKKSGNNTSNATNIADHPPSSTSEPMQLDQHDGGKNTPGTPQVSAEASSEDGTSGPLLQQPPNLNDQALARTEQPTPKKSSTKPKTDSPKPKSMKKSQQTDQKATFNEETYNKDNGRTNYASSRLRRTRNPKPINYQHLTNSSDPLTMVKCEPFDGKPGSDSPGAQPFEMTVHSNVLLTMDFHSHLMQTEIIGFLAGEWDKTTKRILVKEAYPCRSLNTGQNEVNVEMDPTSAIETRQMIEDKNMVVVGWYHSHPTFVPDPSLVDIENQCNYQRLCRDECHTVDETLTPPPSTSGSQTPTEATPSASSSASTTTSLSLPETDEDLGKTHHTTAKEKATQRSSPSVVIEPFVGAIVGPYDPLLPASASVINWFHVGSDWNERRMPKKLVYDLIEDSQFPLEDQQRLLRLPEEYQLSPEKVNFRETWRQNSDETKLEKLIKSLGTRMPWVQKQLQKIQLRQQQNQDDMVASLSESVSDITMANAQVDSNGDITMKDQGPASGDSDSGHSDQVVDSFLEKVQATLMNW